MKTVSDLSAFTFALRVMADRPPKACDAAYLFGEHEDVEVSVLSAGHDLYFDGFASKIAITALGPYCGYTGFEQWRAALRSVGVGDNTIVPIARTPHEISNTFTEAEELVRHAKQVGWKRIICVAPAFHLPRAFLGIVTVLCEEYPELKVYAHCGSPLPWNKMVTHSQGVTKGTPAELVQGEFERILKYDNLDYPSVAVEYLDGRDA